MPKSPEQSGVFEDKSIEALKKDKGKVWEYWKRQQETMEDMEKSLELIQPVREEIERDPNRKDSILLSAMEIMRLQLMLETKKSWPTSEESKSGRDDLMEHEARERLQQEKAKLERLLQEHEQSSKK